MPACRAVSWLRVHGACTVLFLFASWLSAVLAWWCSPFEVSFAKLLTADCNLKCASSQVPTSTSTHAAAAGAVCVCVCVCVHPCSCLAASTDGWRMGGQGSMAEGRGGFGKGEGEGVHT